MKTKAPSAIPAVIKTCREAAGLSQDYMAKRCGCSQTMIAMVEKGEKPLTVDMLKVYAEETNEPWLNLIVAGDVIVDIVKENIRTKKRMIEILQGA